MPDKLPTKLYKVDGALRRISDDRLENDTDKTLKDYGYTVLPDSTIDVMKPYVCDETDAYAVSIINGQQRYIVLIDIYVKFMQHFAPIAHIFEHSVQYAG
jgi:hypothetical protein